MPTPAPNPSGTNATKTGTSSGTTNNKSGTSHSTTKHPTTQPPGSDANTAAGSKVTLDFNRNTANKEHIPVMKALIAEAAPKLGVDGSKIKARILSFNLKPGNSGCATSQVALEKPVPKVEKCVQLITLELTTFAELPSLIPGFLRRNG